MPHLLRDLGHKIGNLQNILYCIIFARGIIIEDITFWPWNRSFNLALIRKYSLLFYTVLK